MTTQPEQIVPITEASFIQLYGDHEVAIAALKDLPTRVTLNLAISMEEAMCPVPSEKRVDPKIRLKQLAIYIGSEALLPEHQSLLED